MNADYTEFEVTIGIQQSVCTAWRAEDVMMHIANEKWTETVARRWWRRISDPEKDNKT